jgi:thioredoxin 1
LRDLPRPPKSLPDHCSFFSKEASQALLDYAISGPNRDQPPAHSGLEAAACLQQRLDSLPEYLLRRSRAMSIINITNENFESEVLKAEQPVLVDFWAEWCGPCKMIAPILEQVADEYQGRLSLVKLDVEENQNIAMQYGVRSIPTLMLFKGGVVEAQHVGMLSKEQLGQLLDEKL